MTELIEVEYSKNLIEFLNSFADEEWDGTYSHYYVNNYEFIVNRKDKTIIMTHSDYWIRKSDIKTND